MKLRNKKTGRVIEFFNNTDSILPNSLAELNEEWEDYKEPKGANEIDVILDAIREYCNEHLCYSGDWEKIKILNIVEEKLKAWKRLKDKGFRFDGWTIDDGLSISICTNIDKDDIYDDDKRGLKEDLDLLFCDDNDDDYMPTNVEINDLTDIGYGG